VADPSGPRNAPAPPPPGERRVARWPLGCLAVGLVPAALLLGTRLLLAPETVSWAAVRDAAAFYADALGYPFAATVPVALLGWWLDYRDRHARAPEPPVRFPGRGPPRPAPRAGPRPDPPAP
jgi:hypothetical protein